MAAQADASSTRAKALARRKAMSTGGKTAIGGQTSAATVASSAAAPASRPVRTVSTTASRASDSTRKTSLERRKAMSTMGKRAVSKADRIRGLDKRVSKLRRSTADAPKGDCGCGCKERGEEKAADSHVNAALDTSVSGAGKTRIRRGNKRAAIVQSTAKAASLARRKAQSSRGKAGISKNGMSEAQTARATNPSLSSRDLAQAVRNQRSKNGSSGQKKSEPCGRRRKASDNAPGAAQDAPWKVGASETSSGQTVTGTMVGRKSNMTGDEPSTCRAVTGTEYLGADIFREFCQSDSSATTARKVTVTTTSHGNSVSGNRMGRATNVTGNEQGTCKRVTGGEYVSSEQVQGYCAEFADKSPRKVSMAETNKGKAVTGNNVGRSERVTGDEYGMRKNLTGTQYTQSSDIGGSPSKVGVSATLRGGSVTGTMVGRRERMTGDEAGSCRDVTGDDYIGEEQYSGFCDSKPKPQDQKVGVSRTPGDKAVTGSMTGRSLNVTGDEPGTCKAVTGTPYAGSEQYGAYCEAPEATAANARLRPNRGSFGAPMTGQQPAVGGVMTGDQKGACEPVTGTPYVGADQAASTCPASASEPGSPDFPQPIEGAQWGDFSVSQAPSHASRQPGHVSHVTGSQYEQGQAITGPFDMADGKITGTEQARFGAGARAPEPVPESVQEIDGRVKSRITGEGQDAGSKITGDDWERGDHVTGTEGVSATRRNMSLRGAPTGAPTGAMGFRATQQPDMPEPVSKVTGSSGNTETGSLITFSGGARG